MASQQLPEALAAALRAFKESRSSNLLAAGEALAVLVDLTGKLSTELSNIGGDKAAEKLSSASLYPTSRITPPSKCKGTCSLYTTADISISKICHSYNMFVAARTAGKFAKQLKYYERMLHLVATLSAALAKMSEDSSDSDEDAELNDIPPMTGGTQFRGNPKHQHQDEHQRSVEDQLTARQEVQNKLELSQQLQQESEDHPELVPVSSDSEKHAASKPLCSEESAYESSDDSSYTGSNDSNECPTITLEQNVLERPKRAAAAEAKTKMADYVGEEQEEEEGDLETQDSASVASAGCPLTVTDPNKGSPSNSMPESNVTANAQRITPAKKMKKIYKPEFSGEEPDAEDAGFELFRDKHGRDCS